MSLYVIADRNVRFLSRVDTAICQDVWSLWKLSDRCYGCLDSQPLMQVIRSQEIPHHDKGIVDCPCALQ